MSMAVGCGSGSDGGDTGGNNGGDTPPEENGGTPAVEVVITNPPVIPEFPEFPAYPEKNRGTVGESCLSKDDCEGDLYCYDEICTSSDFAAIDLQAKSCVISECNVEADCWTHKDAGDVSCADLNFDCSIRNVDPEAEEGDVRFGEDDKFEACRNLALYCSFDCRENKCVQVCPKNTHPLVFNGQEADPGNDIPARDGIYNDDGDGNTSHEFCGAPGFVCRNTQEGYDCGCNHDDDCGAGVCNVQTGECRCDENSDCQPGGGFPGAGDNKVCLQNLGSCGCNTDEQCDGDGDNDIAGAQPGYVCIAATAECGCNEDGDCTAGSPFCDTQTGQCFDGCRGPEDCGAYFSDCNLNTHECETTGCLNDRECVAFLQHADAYCDTRYSTPRCELRCNIDSDCETWDDYRDFRECVDGMCTYMGCATDQECRNIIFSSQQVTEEARRALNAYEIQCVDNANGEPDPVRENQIPQVIDPERADNNRAQHQEEVP